MVDREAQKECIQLHRNLEKEFPIGSIVRVLGLDGLVLSIFVDNYLSQVFSITLLFKDARNRLYEKTFNVKQLKAIISKCKNQD